MIVDLDTYRDRRHRHDWIATWLPAYHCWLYRCASCLEIGYDTRRPS